jgi:hypothetical protein
VELRVENPISWQRIVGASVFMNATANHPAQQGKKKGATMTRKPGREPRGSDDRDNEDLATFFRL